MIAPDGPLDRCTRVMPQLTRLQPGRAQRGAQRDSQQDAQRDAQRDGDVQRDARLANLGLLLDSQAGQITFTPFASLHLCLTPPAEHLAELKDALKSSSLPAGTGTDS